MRSRVVASNTRQAPAVPQSQVPEYPVGHPQGPDQAISFHCRACNQRGIAYMAASFNDLLEHIGLYHSELYPNLAIAPLAARGDLKRWIPKIEDRACGCICGCRLGSQGARLCPTCRTLTGYQAQFPLRFLIQRHG